MDEKVQAAANIMSEHGALEIAETSDPEPNLPQGSLRALLA